MNPDYTQRRGAENAEDAEKGTRDMDGDVGVLRCCDAVPEYLALFRFVASAPSAVLNGYSDVLRT